MKILKEATWSFLSKNAAQPSLTVRSSENLVCSFTRHLSMIWLLWSLRRCLECAWRFRSREHCSLVRFESCSPSNLGKTSFLLLSFFQNHFQCSKLFLHHPQPPLATTNCRCSPLKPHTERNPSTEAESSNLPRGFGREWNPNLTFHFPLR